MEIISSMVSGGDYLFDVNDGDYLFDGERWRLASSIVDR